MVAAILVAAFFGVVALAMALQVYRLRHQLHDAKEQATAVRAERNRFVELVGHELRNPLNAILGMVESVGLNTLPPPQRQPLLVIRSAADNMLSTANNLLALASLEDPSQVGDVNLPRLLASLSERLAPVLASKSIHFETHQEPGCPARFMADVERLGQILLNVVLHAVALTEKGYVEITVHALPANDSTLHISIAHTGPRLSAQASAEIFDPFVFAAPYGDELPPGIGLNLFVARAQAKKLGGDVSYAARMTAGCVYQITLPVVMLAQPSEPAEVDPEQVVENSSVVSLGDPYVRHRKLLPSQRILVVEDQPSNQLVIAGILEKAGHSIVIANNGDEALDQLQAESFDVVLVDLRLPRTSGINVMKLSRFTGTGQSWNIPFIVLTGDASEKTRMECYSAGASAFLTKPVSAHRLLDALVKVREQVSHAAVVPIMLPPSQSDEVISADAAQRMSYGSPPRILESVRDALRYLSEIDSACASKEWQAVRDRVRAIRGIAYTIGAMRVVACCRRICSMSDEVLAGNRKTVLAELSAAVEEARSALATILRQSQPQN